MLLPKEYSWKKIINFKTVQYPSNGRKPLNLSQDLHFSSKAIFNDALICFNVFFGVHVPPDSDLCSGLRVVASTLAAADVILIHSPLTKWKSRWHLHCGFSPLVVIHLSFLPHCTFPSVDISHDFKCVPSSLSEKNRRQYIKDEWIAEKELRPKCGANILSACMWTDSWFRSSFHVLLCTYLKRINKTLKHSHDINTTI